MGEGPGGGVGAGLIARPRDPCLQREGSPAKPPPALSPALSISFGASGVLHVDGTPAVCLLPGCESRGCW